MKIDLKQLFDNIGAIKEVQMNLDLSDLEQWGSKPLKHPVNITGEVMNRAGIVSFSYLAEYTIETQCDRCLEDVTIEKSNRFEHIIVESLNQDDNDDYIVVEDGILDLDELVASDITLTLPFKVLCDDNCKGLCPDCGKNLNKEKCDCHTDEWADPRLKAAFGKLFD